MPLYEYKCKDCDHTIERMQKISDPSPSCPKCKGETQRQIGLSSFRLKGPGWESDGYQKKEGKGWISEKGRQVMKTEVIVFQKKCPVCENEDIEVEECLGPLPFTGSRRRKAYTGECLECFAGFEIVSGKVTQIREGRQ